MNREWEGREKEWLMAPNLGVDPSLIFEVKPDPTNIPDYENQQKQSFPNLGSTFIRRKLTRGVGCKGFLTIVLLRSDLFANHTARTCKMKFIAEPIFWLVFRSWLIKRSSILELASAVSQLCWLRLQNGWCRRTSSSRSSSRTVREMHISVTSTTKLVMRSTWRWMIQGAYPNG